MYTKTISLKKFSCGDEKEETVKFKSYEEITKDSYIVKTNNLGSKRVSEKYRVYGYRNP